MSETSLPIQLASFEASKEGFELVGGRNRETSFSTTMAKLQS